MKKLLVKENQDYKAHTPCTMVDLLVDELQDPDKNVIGALNLI
jgi:hypothetical protein